ncbi:Flp family type IVb pilin [Methylorubrum extorquens]|uniref:Flp family type IVb pilin n=1 Tax=Methylorubrum extorquens TaxID=408 RepID=UPI000158F141|nr:Flp family type IVb pilin [Methylorubrum extorquens]
MSAGNAAVFFNSLKLAASSGWQYQVIASRPGRCAVSLLPPSAPVPKSARPLYRSLVRFARHESGATAIEYGLVSTFIGIAVIGAFRAYGTALGSFFPKIFELFVFE